MGYFICAECSIIEDQTLFPRRILSTKFRQRKRLITMVNTQIPKPHKNPHSKFSANRVFTLNNPQAPRLCPELAKEIGLNESLIFLQIEYWIAISDNERDGCKWTYQTIADIQRKAFSFWSERTIKRVIASLVKRGLLIKGNYNEKAYDKTNWYAINFDEAAKLKSLTISGAPSLVSDCRYREGQTVPIHSDKLALPIPETTSEIKKEKKQSNLVTLDPAVLETENLPASFAVASDQEIEEHGKEIGNNPNPPFPPSRSKPLTDRLRLSLGQATDNFLKWAAAYTDAEIDAALTELLTRKNINSPSAMLKVLLRNGWSKQKKTGSKKPVNVPTNDLEFETYAQRFRNQPALAAVRFCADHGAEDHYTKSLATHLFINAKQKTEALFKIFQLHKQHRHGSVVSPLNLLRGLVGVSPLNEIEEENNRSLWLTQNRSNAA